MGWIGLNLCDGLGWVEYFLTHHDELGQKISLTQSYSIRFMHTPNSTDGYISYMAWKYQKVQDSLLFCFFLGPLIFHVWVTEAAKRQRERHGREFISKWDQRREKKTRNSISNMGYFHWGAQEVGILGWSYGGRDSITVHVAGHFINDGGSSGWTCSL